MNIPPDGDLPDAFTLEQHIGLNVMNARQAAGLSRTELGERVAEYFGKPWPRQTVARLEAGTRAFAAAEIFALAQILKTTPAALYRVMGDDVQVGEVKISMSELLAAANVGDTAELLEALFAELNRVYELLDESARWNRTVGERVEDARERVSQQAKEVLRQYSWLIETTNA